MIVVSDSTPLMHFEKANRLNLLRLVYHEVIITEVVYRETVIEGINIGKKDAFLIEKATGKWIMIVNPKGDPAFISKRYKIHHGEAASILLAKQLNADLLLINERDGRDVAKLCNINVKGTISIISDCVKRDIIKKTDAIEILLEFKKSPSEYWINPEIIKMAIESFSI